MTVTNFPQRTRLLQIHPSIRQICALRVVKGELERQGNPIQNLDNVLTKAQRQAPKNTYLAFEVETYQLNPEPGGAFARALAKMQQGGELEDDFDPEPPRAA